MDSGKTEPAPPTIFQKYFGRSRLYEFEVILFGFALVLGNRNYAWNQAIKYGYKLIALNIFLVGSAFVCLCFCMGEMTSALPFSGGIFGFVRAASGPYYGFIVACFETLFCLSISIVGVHACVEILEATGLIDSSLNPLVICLLYGFNLLVNLIGGKPFWTFVGLAGFVTFVLIMIFILGTAIDVKTSSVSYIVNCARYDQKQPTNVVLAQRWITIFQFQGLQYLPLLSEYTQDPRKSIPRAMSICSVAFVLASFLVTLAACSTYPGQPGLKDVVAPLMYGYRHMLNTTLETGIWLHFPGILAPTMTMLYCSGRQLYMIAKSGLLPSVLTYHTPQTGTPAITLTLAAIVGAVLNVISYYNDTIYTQIINIALLASHIVFINAFIAYIFFRWKYASLPRSFVNPLGRFGVIYGLGNNALGIIAVIFFNANGGVLYTLILLACFTALATFFYWFYMVKHQTFSAEERKLMFKAYLINANRQKRGRVIKNNKVGNAPATTTNGKSLSNNGKSISANAMNQSTLVRDTANYESITEPACISPRQAEFTNHNSQKLHGAKSVSEKIVQFFSEKMNAISPEALHDYQQLAVLSSGGVIEPSEERQLEERLGIDDVEQSAVNE